jgi:hypothetical protein
MTGNTRPLLPEQPGHTRASLCAGVVPRQEQTVIRRVCLILIPGYLNVKGNSTPMHVHQTIHDLELPRAVRAMPIQAPPVIYPATWGGCTQTHRRCKLLEQQDTNGSAAPEMGLETAAD